MSTVIITSPADGSVFGTTITDAETGVEIKGVCGLSVHFQLDDIVRATVQIAAAQLDATAEAAFFVAHPQTGLLTQVAEVVFADGSRWAPET